MANRDDDLLVHLKLDDINPDGKSLTNNGYSKIVATVSGADLVADDTFGACLSFDGKGNYVEVPNTTLPANPVHTLETWIKADVPQKRAWMLLLGQAGNGSHHWLLNPKTDQNGTLQIGNWGSSQDQFTTFEIPLHTWTHLATTYDGKELKFYLNGIAVEAPKATTFNLTNTNLVLGRTGISGEDNFKGHIAHLRLYRRALTAEEIKTDMLADGMALPAYRDAHPIAFSLQDEDENYVLYIDDDPKEKQPLILELRNTSARAIRFVRQAEQDPTKNYHFRLIFRPGALSDKTLTKLMDTQTAQGKAQILKDDADQWDIFCPGEDPLSGTVSIYFLYKVEGKNFEWNQRLTIKLQNISAQPGPGARGTRVELRLNQLNYMDDTVSITGSRVQHLQILNRVGSRHMPLHASFAGSNRVLNDKVSSSELTLQLVNVLPSEFDTVVTLRPDSCFLLTFDGVEDDKTDEAPWSLCTNKEIANFGIEVVKTKITAQEKPKSDTGLWHVVKTEPEQGKSGGWRISPNTELALKRGNYIQIKISNIKSCFASGLTNLYLDYRGIDGFRDGQVVLSIEKAPLLFRPGRNNMERRVGIDTPNPQNILDVKGSVVIGSTYAGVYRAPDNTDLLVQGNVGIGTPQPNAKLTVLGEVYVAGAIPGKNNLTVLGNVGIGSQKSDAKLAVMGGGVHIGDTSDPGENNLTVQGNFLALQGKVGIGTDKPAAKLSVKGGVRIDSDPNPNLDPGAGNLYVAGKVEIKESLGVGGTVQSDYILANKVAINNVIGIGDLTRIVPKKNAFIISFQRESNHPLETRVIISQDGPVLTVCGGISEQMEIIHVDNKMSNFDWRKTANHPIHTHFLVKLKDKPIGTVIRAITDAAGLQGCYFEAWVANNKEIRIIQHPQSSNDSVIAGSGGIGVSADN